MWPGESPIGKRIGDVDTPDPKWAEIVGLMRDFKGVGEFYNPRVNGMRFIRPWSQDNYSGRGLIICLRTAGPPGPMKETVRKVIGQLLPDLALNYLATVDEARASTFSYFTFLRRVLVHIAALGLLLSAIGIYGVVANLATERTKEIGIRMALGAQTGDIVWLFLRNGLVLASFGALLGLGIAYGVIRVLHRILPVLPGSDLSVVLSAALILVAVALFACWLPAWKTTRINPTEALRAE